LLALVGCKRHPAPALSDAGSPVVVKEPLTPVVKIAPDKLEIIATAKGLFEPRLKQGPRRTARRGRSLRGPDDLWITARCGPDLEHGIDVVLRRGHAQKLLEMK